MTLQMASSSGEQLPGQVVPVLQGGGALGAYQIGVYQALHEAGVEPDWVIGTSIGAVNGAIIAGNETEKRLPRLHEFWDKVRLGGWVEPMAGPWANHWYANLSTYIGGIPGFFMPRAIPWGGMYAPLGVYSSSWYRTEPLHATLAPLIDFELLKAKRTRLTVGAVNVKSGELRYFDNTRDPEPLALQHVMASGALPPAFPAIAVDGEPYWDGGIYSNTPIEAVLDDHPRRDSVIFSVNVWHQTGDEPESIWQVMGRQKDIQFASRADSHIAKQKQIHHLRHVIRELTQQIPASKRADAQVKELSSWGCGTTMHVAHLVAPRLDGEDHTKDIDFSTAGVRARWQAGYRDTLQMIERSPWQAPVDPMEGVIVHTLESR